MRLAKRVLVLAYVPSTEVARIMPLSVVGIRQSSCTTFSSLGR